MTGTLLGTWDAYNNIPFIVNGMGNPGDTYLVIVPGTRNLGSGPITFAVNNEISLDGTLTWRIVPASGGGGGGMTNPMTSAGDIIYSIDSIGTPARLGIGSSNQVLTTIGGFPSWQNAPAGSGTVTSVSVSSANGFSGSVSSPSTTPIITLNTTTSGILKGSAGALVPATDTDVTSKVLTGYVITTGTVTSSDTILTAIEKLSGAVSALAGGITFKGLWDANTNTPTLTSSVGTTGDLWEVNVAGTTNLNGITSWAIGDFAIFNGSIWQKIPGTTSAVLTVNGLTGHVPLTGTANRLSISGSNVFDIDTAYVGQSSITTVGTISTGVWHGTSIDTLYTDAKIKTVTGTSNRLTISGTSTDPIFDIASTYAGQPSINTVGTISAGTWTGTTVGISYGGTGQTTANAALNALLPSQGGNSGKYLQTNGTNTSWVTVPAGTGTVTSISTSAPLTGGTITSTGTLGITQSSGLVDGYLSSADWTTFNGKQAALSGTGIVKSVSGVISYITGTSSQFVKADGSLDSSTYLTGNQTITLSGDISGSGTTSITTTIGASKVTNSMLAGSIAASKLVGTDIATVGTITSGTWNGTKISEIYGGTNQSTYTTGDILYASATNTLSKLAVGTNGQVLTLAAGIPSWATPTTGTVTSIATSGGIIGGTITSTGTISLASITAHSVLANTSGSSGTPSSALAYSATPTASTLATWDANVNMSAANFIEGYTTTSGSTQTLTVASTYQQYYTGTTCTVTMPVTSTLVVGMSYMFMNGGSGNLTINSSGGNLIQTILPGASALIECIGTTHTTAVDWSIMYTPAANTAGTTLTTSITGNAATVTTNANLTGDITSTGNAVANVTSLSHLTTASALVTTGTMTSGTLSTGYVIGGVTMTLGSDATGDIYYRNSSGVLTRVAAGSQNTLLRMGASSVPAWSTETWAVPSTSGKILVSDGTNWTATANPIVNNAVTVSSNAATVPVTYRLTTVTNNAAGAVTITMTTSGATDGQLTMVRFYDFSAVTQTITWVNTENSVVSAPTTSNGSTTLPITVGFMYNSQTSKWRCIASS